MARSTKRHNVFNRVFILSTSHPSGIDVMYVHRFGIAYFAWDKI
jgi:hypothetical protein